MCFIGTSLNFMPSWCHDVGAGVNSSPTSDDPQARTRYDDPDWWKTFSRLWLKMWQDFLVHTEIRQRGVALRPMPMGTPLGMPMTPAGARTPGATPVGEGEYKSSLCLLWPWRRFLQMHVCLFLQNVFLSQLQEDHQRDWRFLPLSSRGQYSGLHAPLYQASVSVYKWVTVNECILGMVDMLWCAI